MTVRCRSALLASLFVAALVLSGCAASNEPSTSSTTTKKTTPPRTSTSTSEPPIIVTQTVTVTQTHSSTSSSTTSTPPPPPPPPGGGDETPADNAPIVNNTRTTSVADTLAVVAWDLDDDGPTTSSRVEFGVGAGNFSARTQDQLGVGPRTQNLAGLRSCTTYVYRVSAVDGSGHNALGIPAIPTFTTTGTAPTVTGIQFQNVMHTSLTVSWTVNGPEDTVTQVDYGTTVPYGLHSAMRTGNGVRSVAISGLAQNTEYNFRIHIMSPCGDSVTPNIIQRTAEKIHIDINGNFAGVNSFSPGSSSPLSLVHGRYYVFEVKNLHSMTHTFNIETLNPAYNSGDIPAGITFTFPASISFPTAGTTFHMRCSYHNSGPSAMDGTINIT